MVADTLARFQYESLTAFYCLSYHVRRPTCKARHYENNNDSILIGRCHSSPSSWCIPPSPNSTPSRPPLHLRLSCFYASLIRDLMVPCLDRLPRLPSSHHIHSLARFGDLVRWKVESPPSLWLSWLERFFRGLDPQSLALQANAGHA